jgi:hypothetical protein
VLAARGRVCRADAPVRALDTPHFGPENSHIRCA